MVVLNVVKDMVEKLKYNSLSEWRKDNPEDYKSAFGQGFIEKICYEMGWGYNKRRRYYYNHNYLSLGKWYYYLKFLKENNHIINIDKRKRYHQEYYYIHTNLSSNIKEVNNSNGLIHYISEEELDKISDKTCSIIGSKNYQLGVGILPISENTSEKIIIRVPISFYKNNKKGIIHFKELDKIEKLYNKIITYLTTK